MFNPMADLNTVYNAIINDQQILSLMGLTDKTSLEVKTHIIRKNAWWGLSTPENRLMIYYRPSRRMPNIRAFAEVIQIDCHVPESNEYRAYEILGRVHQVLTDPKLTVQNKPLFFDGQLGQLATSPGFFCAGSRFVIYKYI